MAVLVSRTMVTAVGWVRWRTTVSVTGVRCATARAAALIWGARRWRKTGIFIGAAALAGCLPAGSPGRPLPGPARGEIRHRIGRPTNQGQRIGHVLQGLALGRDAQHDLHDAADDHGAGPD